MWEKGESGNPGGRPKTRPWREALERALRKKDEEANAPLGTTLVKIAERCVDDALTGDKVAMKEVAERHDGKAAQVVIGDSDEDAIRHDVVIRREIIDPAPDKDRPRIQTIAEPGKI